MEGLVCLGQTEWTPLRRIQLSFLMNCKGLVWTSKRIWNPWGLQTRGTLHPSPQTLSDAHRMIGARVGILPSLSRPQRRGTVSRCFRKDNEVLSESSLPLSYETKALNCCQREQKGNPLPPGKGRDYVLGSAEGAGQEHWGGHSPVTKEHSACLRPYLMRISENSHPHTRLTEMA